MTKDEIARIASAAEMPKAWVESPCTLPELERFARLVAAAEREACALLVEKKAATNWVEMAAAIRKRGKLLA